MILVEKFSEPSFTVQAIVLSSLFFASAICALLLSTPNLYRRFIFWLPHFVLFIWAVMLGYLLFTERNIHGGHGLVCIRDIIVFGALPGIVLLMMLRKGATLYGEWAGSFAILAVSALGALGTQFICKNDNSFHVLLWHFLPVAIFSVIGFLVGRKLISIDYKIPGE